MANSTVTTASSRTASRFHRGDAVNESPLRRKAARKRNAKAMLYIVPAALVYALFAMWPVLNTVFLSLQEWDGILPATWVGFDNYIQVFSDPFLLGSIVHSLILIIFFSIIPVAVGLLMTALLLGKVKRGMTFFRVVFFLPQVLPLVAVGVTWRWLYSGDGVINQFLSAIGLDAFTRAWLGDYNLALVAVGLIGTWAMSGLCMVLFLSGAQKIDTALYEAVKIDGGGPVRQFFSITMPGLRGEITIASVITTIAALASFDLVFVTTNGGPTDQTTVPGLLVYRLAFSESDIGTASALAVTLTLLVIIIVSLIRFFTRERA